MNLLVACRNRLLLVDPKDRSVQVVSNTPAAIYGLSWSAGGQELYVAHSGLTQEPRTLAEHIDSERGWLAAGNRRSAAILSSPHQLHCAGDTIVVTNTGRNCLTLFRADDLSYRHHWLDDVRWDRLGPGLDRGSHFNSVVVRGARAYVVAHNFERGSYLLVLSWPDLLPLERLECSAMWAHNAWPLEDGRIIVCDSRHSRLMEVTTGEPVWTSGMAQTLTRGLACRDGHVFVGKSALLDAGLRPHSDGGIWVLDRRDMREVDFIALPGSGPVHEVRVLEGDECHHGLPFRGQVVPDPAATEDHRARMRSPGSGAEARRHVSPPASLPYSNGLREVNPRELGAPWKIVSGCFHVTPEGLRPAAKTLSLAVLEGVVESDVSVSACIDVTTSSTCYAGLLARYRGPEDGGAYLAMLFHRQPHVTADLWKHSGSGWVLLRSVPVPSGAGVLGLQVHGSTLALYFDGALLHREEDDDLPGVGTVGVRAFGGRLRDFRAERLVAPPATLVQPAAPPGPAAAGRPFRLGLWCDFGSTLTPHEGIGVFVHNLARGLLELPDAIELAVIVHQGEEEVMAELKALAPQRVRVLPEGTWSPANRQRLFAVLRRWLQLSSLVREGNEKARAAGQRFLRRCKEIARAVWRRLRRRDPRAVCAVGLLGLAGLGLWMGLAAAGIAAAVLAAAAAPLALLDSVARRLWCSPRLFNAASYRELIARADCDVWVIPYIGFEHPIDFPAVVFIHDLVIYHYPEMFDRRFVEHLEQIVPRRAAEATLCACMSEFIRRTDLLGVLQLPPEKVRMVRASAPRDAGQAEAVPVATERPFLFYPAAFRGYKNHGALIEALHVLAAEHGETGFDVVFTGPNTGELPGELEELARRLGVRQRVRVLGRVDRAALSGLYRGAFAVIVPSLYEQGSFPIYEALANGCPVACSDIPSLREQCAALGGTMLYFDPRQPRSLAQTVLRLRDEREEVRRRQQTAARALWERTWADVARDWLVVFREAALARAGVAKPAAKEGPPGPGDRWRVLLFLPCFYAGGVWRAVRDLVRALAQINSERQQLEITLGLVPEQLVRAAEEFGDGVSVCAVELAQTDRGIGGKGPSSRECVFDTGADEARRAEAWVALVDRFEGPLRRERPYGVFVHDMIQRHAPESFDSTFLRRMAEGGGPTVRGADVVFVTSPATQRDVQEEHGLPANRFRLVPVACEPHVRFGALVPRPVALPRRPYILNVTNAAPHKGAEPLLRAGRRLKDRLGADCPLLVVCGWDTQHFYRHAGSDAVPHWRSIRALVGDLGLVEGEDVVFLGQVSDAELMDLFQGCAVAVNAARYDNGSFSLIEARYFGKPTVSSDYPASRYLYSRFAVPARFFPVDDDERLAEALAEALREPPVVGEALEGVRAALAAPALGHRRHAESVYEAIVELAARGRANRAAA